MCGKQGHEARNYRSNGARPGRPSKVENPFRRNQVSAGCIVQSPLSQKKSSRALEAITQEHFLFLKLLVAAITDERAI